MFHTLILTRNRDTLACAYWALALVLLATCTTARAEVPPDPDAVQTWQQLRAHLFGDRPIVRDATGVVRLRVPSRAQDPSVVPVAITTTLEQTEQRHIRALYLVIDANPSPLGAIFQLTPRSGRADIETRVRIEGYGWVRAIAELDDGSLYLDSHYVKAAGGCSAPTATAPDFDAFEPRAKLQLVPSSPGTELILAQLMIQHPNSSGLARDQITHLFIPPYFVRQVEVTLDRELVLNAQMDFTLSKNPVIRFHVRPDGPGELRAIVLDTKDRRVEAHQRIDAIGR
jgi:sulfur-oxidizing protein SoxY